MLAGDCPAGNDALLRAAVIEKLRGQLVSMKKAGGEEPFKTAAGTMLKYIGNVARAPDEEKFRWGRLQRQELWVRMCSIGDVFDFAEIKGLVASWKSHRTCLNTADQLMMGSVVSCVHCEEVLSRCFRPRAGASTWAMQHSRRVWHPCLGQWTS